MSEIADLTNPKQRTSYAIGLDIATDLKARDIDLDPKALAAGITDALVPRPHDQSCPLPFA